MRIDKLKLFRPQTHLIVPAAGVNKRHYAFAHLGENTKFLNVYRFLDILPQYVRHVLIPTTKRPITRLTPELKKALLNHKLRAFKIQFGEYEKYSNINFYLDLSTYLDASIAKWRFTKYSAGKAYTFINSLIDVIDGISKDTHYRVLLYTVNLNNTLNEKLIYKKIFPVFRRLMVEKTLPFDQWLLFFYSEEEGRFVKLWDIEEKLQLNRIRSYLLKLKPQSGGLFEEQEEEAIVTSVADTTKENRKEEIESAVRSYLKLDPTIKAEEIADLSPEDISARAVAYHITGDIDKAKTIVKNASPETKKKIVKLYSDNLIVRKKAESFSTDPIIKMSNVPKLVDNEVPTHILDKRRRDFNENLETDMKNAFNILSKKKIPLKLKSMKKKLIRSPVSEILPTLKDQYEIQLSDPEGEIHTINVDLPHLTDNGTFLVNGRQRILVNQLITYPIFFFKPFYAQLSTVYAPHTIYSKRIKKGAYLMGHLSGYKLPLVLLLFYTIGFKETCRLFNIKYKIFKEKIEDGVRINDDLYLKFDSPTEEANQLINGLNYCNISFPTNLDVESSLFWKKSVVEFTGTRNSIYLIDEVWKNILTPIEIEVLKAHGDPIELDKIVKYMCHEVVEGRVDDRNSLDKQRTRTSEIFTALIIKQVLAAYNEYLAKKMGGDTSAKFEFNPAKAYSEVITSQNVQLLENINPVEEVSMATRISPIGIGGIPDKRAMTNKAMNIHYSYYGNIDPLETPDSASIGITQHLTVGAAIINKRGQFGIKDHSYVKGGEILSSSPAMIPFVESNDGCRVTMASGQLKQAVPLKNPEIPAIQTGYETVLVPLLSDNFIKRTKLGGEVVGVQSDFIKVKQSNGKAENINVQPRLLKSGQGKSGLSVFRPLVKVGQKVSVGQIVAEGGGVKDGQISLGINILTAFMPWYGYNFEDAIVISESAAKKFTSLHVVEEVVYLSDEDDVVFIGDEGENYSKGGIILSYTSTLQDVETHRHLRTDGGTISSIEVYANIDTIPEKLQLVYERFKKRFIIMNGKYPQGHFKEKQEKIEGIMIKFIMQQELGLRKGDKLNNRHFNKGVVSNIEPDDNMPITPWGERIELILNPLGAINRMNNGQILELHAGLISWKLGQLMNSESRLKFMPIYKKVMTLLDGTKENEYSKNLIQKMNSLSDTAWGKLKSKITNKRFMPLIFPPFKTPDREDIITAMSLLGLSPRTKLTIPGFGRTSESVAVGYIHEQKLEHMSEKKMAARSVGGYISKTLSPTAGKRRGGGQKVGEHDLYSLLSWDCPMATEEFFGALSGDHITKNEIISEIVQSGKGSFKQAKSNPVGEMFSMLMLAIHLESR